MHVSVSQSGRRSVWRFVGNIVRKHDPVKRTWLLSFAGFPSLDWSVRFLGLLYSITHIFVIQDALSKCSSVFPSWKLCLLVCQAKLGEFLQRLCAPSVTRHDTLCSAVQCCAVSLFPWRQKNENADDVEIDFCPSAASGADEFVVVVVIIVAALVVPLKPKAQSLALSLDGDWPSCFDCRNSTGRRLTPRQTLYWQSARDSQFENSCKQTVYSIL